MKKTAALILSICMIFLCGCSLTVTKQVSDSTAFSKSEISVTTAQETTQTPSSVQKNSTQKTETVSVKPTTTSNAVSDSKKTAKTTGKSYSATLKNEKKITCTIEISCKTLLNNKDSLKQGKVSFVPTDGQILKKTKVSVSEGSSVFDALKIACKNGKCTDSCSFCTKSGIQLEYTYTPGYNSYYIEGIHQLYEKDCGTMSGWMYSVNGAFPNYGCNEYKVKNGDNIRWLYTCDLGEDIGA